LDMKNIISLERHFKEIPPFEYITSIKLQKKSDARQLDIHYLLSLLSHRVGDYKRAHKYFDLFLEKTENYVENIEYAECVLMYFKLKSLDHRTEAIRDNLASLFGLELGDEVVEDLMDPEKAFSDLTLPECGDCESCPTKDQCYYERWEKVTVNLMKKRKESPVDQNRLKSLFANTI
jgi:hypothetical protein